MKTDPPNAMSTNHTAAITVTGIDERTDLAKVASLDAEIGILYTGAPEGRNRYPRWEWIWQAAICIPRASLHICGRIARDQLFARELEVGRFQRIQVNGTILAMEVERLCELYPSHTIITQHHDRSAHLLCVKAPNHAILIDGSGGRGISPTTWDAPRIPKAVGFAGGLGPDNIASELERIRAHASGGWWVDMEGRLRVDDWFSVDLASECVEKFHAANATNPSPGQLHAPGEPHEWSGPVGEPAREGGGE